MTRLSLGLILVCLASTIAPQVLAAPTFVGRGLGDDVVLSRRLMSGSPTGSAQGSDTSLSTIAQTIAQITEETIPKAMEAMDKKLEQEGQKDPVMRKLTVEANALRLRTKLILDPATKTGDPQKISAAIAKLCSSGPGGSSSLTEAESFAQQEAQNSRNTPEVAAKAAQLVAGYKGLIQDCQLWGHGPQAQAQAV
ncbi:hypothetical protein EV361DRAFT_110322 [Lentinula raphanica]|uniref:Secreted protein n=1 Tax=Lentinula raphanica TaxID=153919 RepID=A0AA38UFB3_9AGAR|nr:hypothetical protein F5880DRAFT_1603331 [Lentinula raphanica]KAJ3839010.1 hypothetical protein F5878DRAFT_641521 [Lentinula raphanica]KAJ3963974.1 hypothetical protein EV361DRAFT_110322 [Lentinula raphanica]